MKLWVRPHDKQQIVWLCEGALAATLSLDTFYDFWRREWNKVPFLLQCFADIEACLEHMPGTRDGPLPAWRSSHDRLLVELDLRLLEAAAEKDERDLSRCRKLLGRAQLARIDIAGEVGRCLNETTGAV